METPASLNAYRLQVETLLRNNFGATGDDLPALIQSCATHLPDDVLDLLTQLSGQADPVPAAFYYGRAVERLNTLKQARVVESLALAGTDGIHLDILPAEDLDSLARLLTVRDRAFKAVANFTFKATLVCVGLLVLWLLLQLL
ncbi:MAG TPA: hypothetical protein VI457_01895 [Methylococcaceae bacterium]|nr:hypothetical protein [Methylococcaceae bacterium]